MDKLKKLEFKEDFKNMSFLFKHLNNFKKVNKETEKYLNTVFWILDRENKKISFKAVKALSSERPKCACLGCSTPVINSNFENCRWHLTEIEKKEFWKRNLGR